MRSRPVAMIIAGSDSGGGAGLQADLKTLTSLGVFGVTVVTGLTAQNTTGVSSIFNVDPQFVGSQFDSIMSDFNVKYGKTGMLGNESVISVVIEKMRQFNLRLVIDPVMVSKTGSPLIEDKAVESMKLLMKEGILSTPNKYEAERLMKEKISSLEDMRRTAKKLYEHFGNVVIKGGNIYGIDTAIIDGQELELKSTKVNTNNLHGSGDVFSASIVGYLSKGMPLVEAVKKAKDFTYFAILNSLSLGKGKGPVDPFSNVESIVEREEGRKTLEELLYFMESNKNFVKLLRDDFKVNVSYLTNYGDIISLAGGVIKYLDKVKIDGPLLLNLDNEITRLTRKTGRKINVVLPFNSSILKKAESGIIKVTESGIDGDVMLYGGNVFLMASTLYEMESKLEVLWS